MKKKLSPYKKEKVAKAVAIGAAGLLGAAAIGSGGYYLYKNRKVKTVVPVPTNRVLPVTTNRVLPVADVIQMEELPVPPPPLNTVSEDDAKLMEHFEYALKKLKISHVQDYRRTYESFCIYYKKYKSFLDLLCKYSGNDAQRDACITRNLRDRYKIENLHIKAKAIASRKCK
jgi:hypothetical protein